MKEIHMKWIKGKPFKIYSLTHYHFFNHKSSQERNQIFNEDLKWEMFTSFRFSIVTHSEYFAQFVNVIIRADAMHNPVDVLFWDVY